VARHKSPKVKKYWPLLEEMQRLINNGARPHAAAVKLAKEHWRDLSKTEDAAVHWLEDNQRKFIDELDPVFAERAEALEWAKALDPPVEWLQKVWEKSLQPEELKKAREAAEERERKWWVKRWYEWFRDDPKAALAAMLDEIKRD
jgi:hypothetical protein